MKDIPKEVIQKVRAAIHDEEIRLLAGLSIAPISCYIRIFLPSIIIKLYPTKFLENKLMETSSFLM
jgi:hypothetical protein